MKDGKPPLDCHTRREWRRRRLAMDSTHGRFSVLGPRRQTPIAPLLKAAAAAERHVRLFPGGRRNARSPRLTETTFRVPGLPAAFDGFTILHLSDLHAGTLDGLIDAAASLVRGLEVDMVALTGDYQTEGWPLPAETAGQVASVVDGVRTREGALAVLGNHDHADMVDALEAVGIRVLVNEHAALTRDGACIRVTGTDDPHRHFSDEAARALGEPADDFRVALVHSPELAGMAERAGYGLYLCGHTHGGQICLPGGRPVFTFCDLHGDLHTGAWRLGGMHGYTLRGTGVDGVPLRYNCPGEAALIVLRALPGG